MISTIVIDLDGTLLNKNNRIGELAREEIHIFCNNGGKLIIASGRHYVEIKEYIEELQCGDSLAICCDGVYVYDALGKLVMENACLSREDVVYVRNIINTSWIDYYTSLYDVRIYNSDIQAFLHNIKLGLKRKKGRIQKIRVGIAKYPIDEKIEKISFMKNNHFAQIGEMLAKRYTIHKYDDGRCEVLNKCTNKYDALKKLEENGSVSLPESLYFGDSINDIECFEHLDYTIAMGNACEKIKRFSSFVTKSNEEDGVGHVLRMLNRKMYNTRETIDAEKKIIS